MAFLSIEIPSFELEMLLWHVYKKQNVSHRNVYSSCLAKMFALCFAKKYN